MSSQTDGSDQEPYYIFTEEEAGRLVTEALETSLDEPEPFIRLLLILHDQERESRLQDSIYILMKAAYKGSIADDKNFEDYLEAIRQCPDPIEEAHTSSNSGYDSDGVAA